MFKLEEKHIVKEGSKIVAVILPEVGEIAIKTKAKKIVDGSWLKSCTFIEHENDTTIELRSTWTLDVSVCGTALVVLHHMGYNLNDSKSIALSSKDTAKVFSKYEELIEQKPELFGAEWAEVAKNIKEKKKLDKNYIMIASRHWENISKSLIGLGLNEPQDFIKVGLYCESYSPLELDWYFDKHYYDPFYSIRKNGKADIDSGFNENALYDYFSSRHGNFTLKEGKYLENSVVSTKSKKRTFSLIK